MLTTIALIIVGCLAFAIAVLAVLYAWALILDELEELE